MKGVLLAGGRGTRLGAASIAVNKHLLPVFDKPLIYYSLSTLMLSGIRDIVVVTGPADIHPIKHLLGSGDHLGIDIHYAIQNEPLGVVDGLLKARPYFGNGPVTLVLGDNVFHGSEFGLNLSEAYVEGKATIFGIRVPDPSRYAVAEVDDAGRLQSIIEKPEHPRSQWIVPGLYVLPSDVWDVSSTVRQSIRGEYEIADVLNAYLIQERLTIKLVSRASYWTDAGTPQSLLHAANYVETMTGIHGELIASPEEVAFRLGLINKSDLLETIQRLEGSDYANLLRQHLPEIVG